MRNAGHWWHWVYSCTAAFRGCSAYLGLACLGLFRLISAYFLSQNTIHSTSPTLFMRSAEHALSLPVAVSVEFPVLAAQELSDSDLDRAEWIASCADAQFSSRFRFPSHELLFHLLGSGGAPAAVPKINNVSPNLPLHTNLAPVSQFSLTVDCLSDSQ
jgi:hypothetical protein